MKLDNSQNKSEHTIAWGQAGFACVGFREDATQEDQAQGLAKLSIAADKAHRILNGESIVITEIDGKSTNIPVNPPDQPDPARIQALLRE